MIGQIITDPETGKPLEQYSSLTKSQYQPPADVMALFARVQQDYQVAWGLQRRSFDEFDGLSLLDRAREDQKTFAAYVGAEYIPQHKRWRWRGRKNTARNKLIKLCARALAGMLYPFVYAKNEQNEEDKMTARVMRILIEEHLRKSGYQMKFLFLVLSALVNPAVFCGVEYVEALQTVKKRLANGEVKILQVVDELLSGLQLGSIPIDELLLSDMYSGTGNIQILPYVIRARRIPWDTARSIHAGKHFQDGKDLFDYVKPGMTRVFMTSEDGSTLFDIDWTEADRDYVQELTIYYRSEDLELTWVGGVGMFDYSDPYNKNPMKHRRMVLAEVEGKHEWLSVPLYPYAMSGFEPIDPTGRFAYYKSGAFKEYWDALAEDRMYQLAQDGTFLDVIKPMFLSGVASVDQSVMIPGAAIGMPTGATATPYALGPNLAAALSMMKVNNENMSDSINSDPAPSTATPNVPATQTAAAVAQAKMFFTVFSLMISDLVTQIGGLSMDCVVQYATVGELDYSVPEALKMKFRTYLAKGKDKGKDITNRIQFTDELMARELTKEEKEKMEWDLYEKSGGEKSDQRIYLVNPYAFARTTYTMFVDPDQIVMKSMGTDRQEKILAFNMMSDPRVAPFTDRKAVVDEFVIEEFGGDDPDKYKAKGQPTNEMLNAIMGGTGNQSGVVVPPSQTLPVT